MDNLDIVWANMDEALKRAHNLAKHLQRSGVSCEVVESQWDCEDHSVKVSKDISVQVLLGKGYSVSDWSTGKGKYSPVLNSPEEVYVYLQSE